MSAGGPGPADGLLAAAELLVRSGVMSSTGHINASARTGDGRMLLSSLAWCTS